MFNLGHATSHHDVWVVPKGAGSPLVKLLGQGLLRTKNVLLTGSVITPEIGDEQVHKLRIECKKLRYMLEFFGSLLPRRLCRSLRKSVKYLQDILGEFSDCSVQQVFFRHYLTRENDPVQHRLIDDLIQGLNQQQLHYRGQVEREFDQFRAFNPLVGLNGAMRQYQQENTQ